MGISELLVNGVEHGNLGLSYAEKSTHKREDTWQEEINRRATLPENQGKRVRLSFSRNHDTVTLRIRDEGAGFDWQRFLEMDPERAFDPNGRGIALARMLSFSRIVYEGCRNIAVSVDVRVISATNKNLPEEIKAGRFREDLYFRLAVVPLRVPPLRERPEELIQLAEAFVKRLARNYGRIPKRLAPDARDTLLRHDWPGNVRELKNLMERALILGRGSEITTRDLGPLATRLINEPDPFSFPEFPSLREGRDWFEGEYIKREMKLQNGNMTRVAERLGLDRSNLYKRLKSLGIEVRES